MPVVKLIPNEIKAYMTQLDNWSLDSQAPSIYKEWLFKDFKSVIQFLNQLCELADKEDHHPEILTTYTNLRIRLWTHDVDGITEKDFSMASAIDALIATTFKESIVT